MPANLRIVYFQARGRAEATRIALAFSGVEFEDVRLPGAELMAKRASGEVKPPFNQFPVIEVVDKGVTLGQSAALLRFAGKLGGIYPEDAVLAAKVDGVVDQLNDVVNAITGIMYGAAPEEKEAKMKALVTDKLPGMLAGVAAFATADKPFLFGLDELTIADIAVMALVENGPRFSIDFAGMAPALAKVTENVLKHPKLAAYFAKRTEVEAAEAAAAAAAAAATAAAKTA